MKIEQDDLGWDEDNKVLVPGFGFYPPRVIELLQNITEIQAEINGYNLSIFQRDTYDDFQCSVLNSTWESLFPHLSFSNKSVCPPMWDGASCVPPTLEGEDAVFPCMTLFNCKLYDVNFNASRSCLDGGVWAGKTNYKCPPLQTNYSCPPPPSDLDMDPELEFDLDPELDSLDMSIYVYTVGYLVSIVALMITLTTYLSFRELRCLRHKIHIGLFLTVILTDLTWLINASLLNLIRTEYYKAVINILCVSQLILRYFHLTTFFWMFLEGLYLFLQVQLPLSLAIVKFSHFLISGWGFPLLNMLIWSLLRVIKPEESKPQPDTKLEIELKIDAVLSCPFIAEAQSTDFYAYKLPIIFLLAINTFFLVWIMVIVLKKLRSQIAMDHDRRHLKAAKALTVIIPLFGLNYFLTLMGPDKEESQILHTIFQLGRSVLISVQGAIITLPYCFLNSEVQGVVKLHWNRWLLVRSVGAEYQSTVVTTTLAQSMVNCTQDVNGSKNKFLAIARMETVSLLSPSPALRRSPISMSSHSGSARSSCEVQSNENHHKEEPP